MYHTKKRSFALLAAIFACVAQGAAGDNERMMELLGKSEGFMTAEEWGREIYKYWVSDGDSLSANEGTDLQPSVRNASKPGVIADMSAYLKWKWRMDLSDPKTGKDCEELKKGLAAIVAEYKAKEPWAIVRARMLDYLVDNCAIGFSRHDCFPAISCWNRFDRPQRRFIGARAAEVESATAPPWFYEACNRHYERVGRIWRDYDHSAPDWDDILKLGFTGMKARVDSISEDTPFYRSEKMAAAALLRFVDRLIACARSELAKCGGRTKEGLLEKALASLERLRVGPPQTVFDVMEFSFVYFIVGEYFDNFQVRTLGNIDRLWIGYYEADLAAGRTTEADFREEFRHFIWQFGSIDNYFGHPMYLGGTKADGTTEYNALSRIILDVVDREALPSPKFQLKIAGNTPDDIWDKALRMLRNHRSLVLMGEEGMKRSMAKLGLSDEDCRKLIIWGCFEWLPVCGNCTSSCDINLVKPVELMLRDAKCGRFDAATFEEFKAEYFRRLGDATDLSRILMDEFERHLAEINPALILSLGISRSLEKGIDAFSRGMRYNHTEMAALAFATVVDSLIAVKELVYEKKELTLAELGETMAADWKGREDMRLRMARSRRKWGCGNAETDALGRELLERFTGRFVGLANVRGGQYVCYGLNSRGYVCCGRVTGATPDGRRAGEELSKNMAPAIGGDAEGVTGVLKSWRESVDPAFFPCGLVFDVMVHSSSVAGDKGLAALRALCENYFENGGCALNLNIQSVEELKDAQLHPEKYENLQVRVAGWNVRWNDIPKKEQDGFIRRMEAMP
jgi:formate C-acetyltransferase